ncbi:MAG TPA: ATP-dependent helicase, partial [Azospirillum sp.]
MPMPSEDLFGAAAPSCVPFAQEDLARVFDPKTLQRGRTLVLTGAVRLTDAATRIDATVTDLGRELAVTVTPAQRGRRISFDRRCACGRPACAHMAAAAMLALDTRPEWRRTSLLDLMEGEVKETTRARPAPAFTPRPSPRGEELYVQAVPKPEPDPVLLAHWTLEPGRDDVALYVSACLIPEGGGDPVPATPREVIARTARDSAGEADRAVARLMGAGGIIRTPVAKGRAEVVDRILHR